MILLDEVEKAHPDVFNILLQLLDDGRLTDGQGRTVDFKNTVIIMTSNLGSDIIQDKFSTASYNEMRDSVMQIVGTHFRPEFINRIDETVVFHPLEMEQIKNIAKIQLRGLQQRLEQKGYKFKVHDRALNKIAAVGFDPVFGARPLKRAIQHEIENPLAQDLLAGRLSFEKTIVVDEKDDKLVFLSKT